MKNFLKKLFAKKTLKVGKTYNMWEHESWGNKIQWFDWGKRKITGHTPFSIEVGDLIKCQMTKGIGTFQVVEIKYENDPIDMFFGVVADFSYEQTA